jgi:N utilization substance protein B
VNVSFWVVLLWERLAVGGTGFEQHRGVKLRVAELRQAQHRSLVYVRTFSRSHVLTLLARRPLMNFDAREARILAMQALCQWDAQGETDKAALRDFFAARQADPAAAEHAVRLVTSFWAYRSEVDRLIAAAAEHWSLSRIGLVDRNVIRTAITELLTLKTPPKVVVSEAIDIARDYGGVESPRFVNGVLDRVYRDIGGEMGT